MSCSSPTASAVPSLPGGLVYASRLKGWLSPEAVGRAGSCQTQKLTKQANCAAFLSASRCQIWEQRSLTSSGEVRSSKSSSILSTNSSVNRICKGETLVYSFTLQALCNCQATDSFLLHRGETVHTFLWRHKGLRPLAPGFTPPRNPNHCKKC